MPSPSTAACGQRFVMVARAELEVVALVAVRGRELVDDAGLAVGPPHLLDHEHVGLAEAGERAEEVVRAAVVAQRDRARSAC